jgi:hypothetical protein
MPFIHVIKANHLRSHRIWLEFSDGFSGEIDLRSELRGEVFEALKDPLYFGQFQIEGGTLTWPNSADFAPEFLYDLAKHPVSQAKSY